MAKTYNFTFTARPASFDGHFIQITFGAHVVAEERRECTMTEAVEYLREFAKRQTESCACRIYIRTKPMPRGYSTAPTIYNDVAAGRVFERV